MFAELGAVHVDADEAVAECYKSDYGMKARLLLAFGPAIFSLSTKVSKRKLADIVFADEKKLALLERIVWPYAHAEIKKRVALAEAGSMVIIEGARLFESGYGRRLEKVVVVECLPEIQRSRLMNYRQMPPERAERIVELQRHAMTSWPFGDYTIYNSLDEQDPAYPLLRRQVRAVWDSLKTYHEGRE